MAIRLILESGYFVEDASKQLIGRHLRELAAQPNIRKIIELPIRGAEALIQAASNRSGGILICTAIGMAGWAAWTAADRIRDEGGLDGDLYVFSILRPIIDELVGKLSLPAIYPKRLKHIIGMMEYANSSHCALGAREWSSWKSMGAAIPLLVLMMKVGATGAKASEIDILNKNIAACESFFYHLILARQLSDDALDWKEDSGGIGNSTLVLNWLEKAFEKRVKYQVAEEILKSSRQAVKMARDISCFTKTEFMEELPRYYEKMALKILARRKP